MNLFVYLYVFLFVVLVVKKHADSTHLTCRQTPQCVWVGGCVCMGGWVGGSLYILCLHHHGVRVSNHEGPLGGLEPLNKVYYDYEINRIKLELQFGLSKSKSGLDLMASHCWGPLVGICLL